MIAGILNKFGKIGVISGFVLGNIILTYVANGLISHLILIKEILIAGIALLAVPRNINLQIESLDCKNKFLPIGKTYSLNKSKETAKQLNNVSKTIKDMANTYKNVAATVIDEEDIKEKNKQIFITELLDSIDNIEENILYDTINNVEGKIVNDIFEHLIEKGFIKEKEIIQILAQNNNYIINSEDKKEISRDIEKMVNCINLAFRISKMNFVWNMKLNEEKQNFEVQLNGVSKAISNIAKDIEEQSKNEELYLEEKEQIVLLLKQKDILVDEISIEKKEKNIIDICINSQKDDEKIIVNIVSKVMKEKVVIQEKTKDANNIKYKIISDDKYILEIGKASVTKDNMPVSGDSIIQTKLKDGKYLLTISDGMGSGIEAQKSSKIVTSMLKRLLNSGFDRDNSIDLINTSLLNVAEDVFATLDIAIIDLYKGNVEFIKNGACPTYIKSNKKIQIIKSFALPTGTLKELSTDVFDKDIENNDIIVMISDGILDSNVEYKNKELWIKYLLEDIEVTNPQKIADIILNESIDNNYGKIKDDMSVIVFKFIKK